MSNEKGIVDESAVIIENEQIMHVFDDENPLPINAVIGDATAVEIIILKYKAHLLETEVGQFVF